MPLTHRPLRRRVVGATAGVVTALTFAACQGPAGSSSPGTSSAAGTGVPSSASSVAPTAPQDGSSTSASTTTAGPSTSGSGTTTGGSPAPAGEAPTDLLTGLDQPWSIAMLPDGSALVSLRNTGDIYLVPKPSASGEASGTAKVVGRLPIQRSGGEGGLLGLAVPVDFDVDPVFYAYYSTADDNRIAAVPWRGDSIADPVVIFSGIPRGSNHNGGRIAFGPDGFLYVGTGDTALSLNLSSLGGKILRITPDGKPAPGNPFGGSPIWSYGHRNVQGLAWDSRKRLWASEFGANTWDELNLVEPGQNYGWPEVEGQAGDPDYVDPVAQWPTQDLSPSGITVGPDGAVYIAALRGESVWRVPVSADGKAGTPQRFLQGTYGRIRDIRFVSDDRAWILTGNGDSDRLVSLPASSLGVG